jgi:PAS domain S-box-containing protein
LTQKFEEVVTKLDVKIAFISPYKKLADRYQEICDQLGEKHEVYIGDLQEGVAIAKELKKKGVDAIVSRGGTALAIAEVSENIPVIEIQVTGFDLIRILNEARQESKQIAIVGFEPFTYGIDGLANIMDINIEVHTLKKEWYNQKDKIKNELLSIKDKGFNCIVGDNISVKITKEMNLKAFLIRSGKEAITKAILEAKKIAEVRKTEIEKAKRVHAIIEYANEGIISIDEDANIRNFNPRAEEIFAKEGYKIIDKNINDILPELNLNKYMNEHHNTLSKIWDFKGKEIVGNVIPIFIDNKSKGLVITVQETDNIRKVEEKIRKKLYLKGYTAENTFNHIIGESEVILAKIEEAKDYAQVKLPLLILGETGTGKELFAQAVHNYSSRSNRPFVAFNCAALPEDLLESELFGYVKGAFTGADNKGKAGLFEQAHGGTLFLDEIGEISKSIQSRLLRVFEERKIRRIGDDKNTPVDVRLILATNRNLINLVRDGKFREDLFYRINVLSLDIPPLRERKEDIPILTKYFIKKSQIKTNKLIQSISNKGLDYLKSYNWPGNVRQLENVIEKLIIRSVDGYISFDLVKEAVESIKYPNQDKSDIRWNLNKSLEAIENDIIKAVLAEENYNKKATADRLGIGRTTLWRKLNNN